MEHEFRTFSSLETVDALSPSSNVLIESNGVLKRIHMGSEPEDIYELFVPETQVALTGNNNTMRGEISDSSLQAFEVGTEYKIIFGSDEYTCTAKMVSSIAAVGNASIMGDVEDTGEPFLIGINPGNNMIVFTTATDNTSVSITIYKIIRQAGGNNTNGITLIPETTVTIAVTEDGCYAELGDIGEQLTPGNTYIVMFNGVEYECVARLANNNADSEVVLIGNGTIHGDTIVGNGEPFSFDSYWDGKIYLNTATIGTYTIALYAVEQATGYSLNNNISVASSSAPPSGLSIKDKHMKASLLNPVEMKVELAEEYGDIVGIIEDSSTIWHSIGTKILVIFNGVEYECAVKWHSATPAIGNLAIVDMGEDTGEPFLILINEGRGYRIVSNTNAHTCTLSMFAIHHCIYPDGYTYTYYGTTDALGDVYARIISNGNRELEQWGIDQLYVKDGVVTHKFEMFQDMKY